MDQIVLLWILGVMAAAVSALAAWMRAHTEHCKDVHSRLARIDEKVDRIVADIGTTETGLRGQVHDHTRDLIRLEARFERQQTKDDPR